MPWIDFNFIDTEALDFSTDAHELILQVYRTSSQKLEEQWKGYQKWFRERSAKGMSEDESGIAHQEMDWEEDLHRQRMQGIGSLALDWLMCS
jgi:hypothetical protein